MKTNSFLLITAGITAGLVSPALAIEAPADDTPPPAVKPGAAALPEIKLQPEAKPAAAAPTAFLGIVSNDVPEILADHLGLKAGEGVVVRALVPAGPAATAGLAENDVILKVAGKPVGSPKDITSEITSHKPGDSVPVEFIHKGKPSKLDVTLGTKPAEIAAADPAPMDLEEFEGLPKDLADKIKGAIAGNLGGLGLPLGADDAQVAPRMEEALRELKERMQGAMGQALLVPDAADANAKIQGASTIRMKDAQGSVELKSTDGAKEVTLRDEEDNVTWNGPWDTAQDKQAAPEDVRKRVDSLNIDHSFKGAGLRLQMGRAGALGE
jgi:membrane-associated protease RseP (regulator of RpoE activity)